MFKSKEEKKAEAFKKGIEDANKDSGGVVSNLMLNTKFNPPSDKELREEYKRGYDSEK